MEKPFQQKAGVISCIHVENEISVVQAAIHNEYKLHPGQPISLVAKKMGWWWRR